MIATRLISVSHPEIPELKTPEDLVAYCARVSNPANQLNNETTPKLLRYLIKNQHWSPFETVSMTIEIRCPRDIGRQVLRHRSFSFQEFSQRYAAVQETTTREARMQDPKNRQNSVELIPEQVAIQGEWKQRQDDLQTLISKNYQWALENGVAKECARVVLAEGMTMSKMYMSGTLRSWIHYCQLRTGNGTQKEHREIANECLLIIREIFPSVYEALQQE